MDIDHLMRHALHRKKAVREHLADWRYLRLTHAFRSVPMGTVSFQGEVIWGYPNIGRLLRLESGLREHFCAPFWVEEKVDGYNVRVCKQGDTLLALTRRGYICWFTTDRLADLVDTRIFEEQPDIVLCAEVAGPDNPYNEGYPPYVTDDVRLFVFDIMRKNSSHFLPHEERMQLIQDYDLPAVTQYGRYRISNLADLKALLITLNEEGKEGVVLKEDSKRDKRAKYVTSQSSLNDIRVTAMELLQLPSEFYTQRILRLALFMDEEDIEVSPDHYAELGEAFLQGVFQAIRQCREHQKVFQTFRCKFRLRSNALLFVQSLQRLLGQQFFRQRRLHKAGDFYVLEFDKVLPRESGLLNYLLRGGLTFD